MLKYVLISVVLNIFSYLSFAQDVAIVAGGGFLNDVMGLEASLKTNFGGIVFDPNNKLLIADTDQSIIRIWDQETGIVSTFAGNGDKIQSGDGGPAELASFNAPNDFVIDELGNIYVATVNHIRKIDAITNIVTTIAGNGERGTGLEGNGGSALEAPVSPVSISMGIEDDIYFSEFNGVVRRIDLETGNVSLIVGNGEFGSSGDGGPANEASIGLPLGVANDSNGDLYISDVGNSVIRKVEISTGLITTVAGNGEFGHSGDGGQGIDAAINPGRISIDPEGNLIISELDRNAIRKIDMTTGVITTIAGNVTKGFSGDGGLATNAQIDSPGKVAFDEDGNFYFVEIGNRIIRRVNITDNTISTVIGGGLGNGLDATQAVLNLNFRPGQIVFDDEGNFYINDVGHHLIRKVQPDGQISTLAGNGTTDFSLIEGVATEIGIVGEIAYDKDNAILISGNSRIQRVDLETGLVSVIAGTGENVTSGDGGLAINAGISTGPIEVDSNGNIYVAGANTIRKIEKSTGIISTIAGTGVIGNDGNDGLAIEARLGGITDLHITNNLLYFIDFSFQRIRQIDLTTGIISLVAGTGQAGASSSAGNGGPFSDASFMNLRYLTIDSIGNIFLADNFEIRKIDLSTGIIDGLQISAPIMPLFPDGLAFDTNGALFISDSNDDRILSIADLISPEIVGLNPPTGSTNVSITTGLAIIFDEEVVVSDGMIRLIDSISGLSQTLLSQTAEVEDNVVTLDLNEPLIPDRNYYIEIDEAAFLDVSGNPFGGISDSLTWTFTTEPEELVTSINQFRVDEFSIYPNPTSNLLNIVLDDDFKPIEASLSDISGSVVFHIDLETITNAKGVDVSGLENGVYFLKVSSTSGTYSIRFLKN